MTTTCTAAVTTPPPPETVFVCGNLIDVAVYARTLSERVLTGTLTNDDVDNLEHAYTLAINACRWLAANPTNPLTHHLIERKMAHGDHTSPRRLLG
ncbi:hypothetical protein [Actinokineospora sp. NBRC 105648]|uniref:hypothetical protein n=1 Tax=Actinokineospora sp. NBRC 105648 TaxID=3032206 RepID=UPI0024A09C2A|nr:hypothetical protein [Actinokineospora sp. NBRC 105648]GLZ37617.1 hypothetical protein Acsp05_12420 [Actinokineospora sp. NBRC 105648]